MSERLAPSADINSQFILGVYDNILVLYPSALYEINSHHTASDNKTFENNNYCNNIKNN